MDSDVPQFILIAIIIILTIILVVLGIQIFFILRQGNEALKKINRVLDGANLVGNPLFKVLIGSALTFFAGQKKVKTLRKNQQGKKVIIRRFFRKSLR